MKVQRQPIRLYYDEGSYHFLGTIQFEIEGHEITDVTAEVEITQTANENYPKYDFRNIICKDEFCNEITCSNHVDLIENLRESLDIYYQ
jgi:hypothetical protein